ncbi:unnamed protein product, partial [Phaeothamnion confervicola]
EDHAAVAAEAATQRKELDALHRRYRDALEGVVAGARRGTAAAPTDAVAAATVADGGGDGPESGNSGSNGAGGDADGRGNEPSSARSAGASDWSGAAREACADADPAAPASARSQGRGGGNVSGSGSSGAGAGADGMDDPMHSWRLALRAVVRACREREAKAVAAAAAADDRLQRAVRINRLLYDKYAELRSCAEDAMRAGLTADAAGTAAATGGGGAGAAGEQGTSRVMKRLSCRPATDAAGHRRASQLAGDPRPRGTSDAEADGVLPLPLPLENEL